MSEPIDTYFGIDLGTTYSAISYVDEAGRPSIIRSPLTNSETTPSVVYFENVTNFVVGQTAKEVATLYPDRVVRLIKREMGKSREWSFDGETYTPESISAVILRRLADDARDALRRDVRRAVITVPAYFGMRERQATRQAGEIAGLEVLGIVPEPVAAALEYDVVDGERTILVYDLGGGTFDTTVIRVSGERIHVLCTDGDQELGGVDWDQKLIEHLRDRFVQEAAPAEDPGDNEQFMQELALTAEETKRQLSQVESRPVMLRFAGSSVQLEVTRQEFAEITADLMDRTIEYTRRTLDVLKEKEPAATIDDVLLVGGSTKMPMVAERLRAEFGWNPRLHDPDLAVAKGAARYALGRALWDWDGEGQSTPEARDERLADISRRTGITTTQLSVMTKTVDTVLPKAFGVKVVDTDVAGWEDDPDTASYIMHLVHANEPLPITVDHGVATLVDQQDEIAIELYEQAGSEESRELTANVAVITDGVASISGLPSLPRNSPIDLHLTIDVEGALVLRGVEPKSEKSLTITARISVLSQEEVSRARRALSAVTVRA